MARHTRITKRSYAKLMDVFRKAKYPSPGVLSRVILESLMFDDGILTSSTFYQQRAGKSGTFTSTRDALEKSGFLIVMKPSGRIIAGRRLASYLSHAKATTAATMEQLDTRLRPVEDDIALLKERMNQIEETVCTLKIASEPPETPAKKKAATKAIALLHELTTKH